MFQPQISRRQMSLRISALLIAVAATCAPGIGAVKPNVGNAATRAYRPHLYHILAGINVQRYSLVVNKFVPDQLTIHTGDSVMWTDNVPNEPQTVTFGPILNTPALITRADAAEISPLVAKAQGGHILGNTNNAVFSSGVIGTGIRGVKNSYTFTFPTPGSYFYRSLFHPSVLAEIVVVPPDQPASSDAVDTGPSILDGLRSVAQSLDQEAPEERYAATTVGGGTAEVEVGVGDKNASIEKFTPNGMEITAGTTVTWTIKESSGDPHVIELGRLSDTEEQGLEPLYTGIAADGGLVINAPYTTANLPSNSTIMTTTFRDLSGNHIYSGILYGSSVNYPSKVPSSYSLNFGIVGQYTYVDPFRPGMEGIISVLPAPVPTPTL